jgi:imidazolonepropionase-like amidohydrolase
MRVVGLVLSGVLGVSANLGAQVAVRVTPNVYAQSASQLSPAVREYVSVSAPVVALTHVRVIDGTGAPATEDQTIIFSNGRITALGPFARVTIPAGAQVMSMAGKTVIPGLFGMHDHTFYPTGAAGGGRNHHPFSAPRLYLASGVTSIRTAGTYEPYVDLNLGESIQKGEVPGPRMNVSGAYIDQERGRVRGPENARRMVDYWADEGATNFKAYQFLTRAELAAAIDEAHKRGLKVTGHLCSVGYREAAAMGIDNLEHGYQTNSEWNPNKKPDECPARGTQPYMATLDINGEQVQATIRDMVAHKVALTSTQAVHECSVPNRPPLRPAFLESLSPGTRESYLQRRARIAADSANPQHLAIFRKGMEFERAFVKAGGILLSGLDPTGGGCSLFGLGDLRNLPLFVEAGFTPLEAIKFATFNGAQFLGQQDSLGSIAVGKLADLVVLDGNPMQNMDVVFNASVVFKNGVGYDPAKLIASVKNQVGIN